MTRVLVPLAEGFEEIETSTVVDVLRRAEIEVLLAGIDGNAPCRGSRGIVFLPDVGFAEAVSGLDGFDLVVLPGGAGGAERLAAHGGLRALLQSRVEAGKAVAAICAAPLALDAAGVLSEGNFTCYPTWAERIRTPGRREDRVVDAGAVITSQGPGTAMEFALHLVARLRGEDVRRSVAEGLLFETSV